MTKMFLTITPVEFLSVLNGLSIELLVIFTFLYLFFGLDDLLIDFCAYLKGLFPIELTPQKFEHLKKMKQKKIAIIVPAWNEGNIIKRMLLGNIAGIDYDNYLFFVGYYPNDLATTVALKEVSEKNNRIIPVVNNQDGPTTKGQILNYVVEQIAVYEKENKQQFDAVLMQDSEDLIHQDTLSLVNYHLDHYDFIQVPVFSLPVDKLQLVAGTYMDEFAESHTKDLLVRESLGASIPSAGVGTALSKSLLLKLKEQSGDGFLNEGSLTEDYELGMRAKRLGFKPHFACCFYRIGKKKEFIATREFFPKKCIRSIRQKTRWTVGIAFQGLRNLGWAGNLGEKYFLYRDRRGPIINFITLFGFGLMLFVSLYAWFFDATDLLAVSQDHVIGSVLGVNLGLMANRLLQRSICTIRVYGLGNGLPILLRWPVALFINGMASMRAVKQFYGSQLQKRKLKWDTTEHELPANFGGQVTAKLKGEA